MKATKVLSLLLTAAMLLAVLPLGVWAESTVSDFEYTITDGEVTITGYNGEGGDVVVPSEIEGYPVTCIGWSAFEYCDSITSIVIPDGVTSISDYAFYDCESLVSVTIPKSVTIIGDYTFNKCSSLISIVIPDSVTKIGYGSFHACSSLISIKVGKDNAVYYSEGNCIIKKSNRELMHGCNNSVIPDGVTSIGYGAFEYCDSLTGLEIPNSVTSIGYWAFAFCDSLTKITIPDSVTSIGYRAFQGCSSLVKIEIDNNNAVYYSKGNCLIEKASGRLIQGCNNSVIPDGVTSIDEYAFYDCRLLTSIAIPDSLTSIGWGAFAYCESLTDIYCEVEFQPEGWNNGWLDYCSATVHWGWKPPVAHGDANGDGEINGADVTKLLTLLANMDADTELPDGADCNGDGVIDGRDAVRLIRYLANYDPSTGKSSVELGK